MKYYVPVKEWICLELGPENPSTFAIKFIYTEPVKVSAEELCIVLNPAQLRRLAELFLLNADAIESGHSVSPGTRSH